RRPRGSHPAHPRRACTRRALQGQPRWLYPGGPPAWRRGGHDAAHAAAGDRDFMTARLAVVDDDAAFTEYLALLLKSRGYEVDIFPSGAALLEALRGGLLPNIVLLDVLMPDIDGLETLRAIRQLHASTQVIMLSGRQTPATIVQAVRLGAADYVLKPGDPEGIGEATLEAAIRHALERESLNEELARLSAQVAEDPQGTQPAWGASAAMQAVTTLVERVADSDVGVLLRGESGVGKEVIARELHRRSSRRG